MTEVVRDVYEKVGLAVERGHDHNRRPLQVTRDHHGRKGDEGHGEQEESVCHQKGAADLQNRPKQTTVIHPHDEDRDDAHEGLREEDFKK